MTYCSHPSLSVHVKFDILGTYVQVDEDLLEATTPRITNSKQSAEETNEKDSGDETGDETDDEGCVSNAKIINYHTRSQIKIFQYF